MIKTEFEWRPHTECPPFNRASAVIAIPAGQGPADNVAILMGIFEWVDGKWEETDQSVCLPKAPFYWALEVDLTATIPSLLDIEAKEVEALCPEVAVFQMTDVEVA